MNTRPFSRASSLVALLVVFSVAGAGTAHAPASFADPVAVPQKKQSAESKVATDSALYRTGKLAGTNCSPGPLTKNDQAGYARFLQHLKACLDIAWAAEFRQAGLGFAPPKLTFVAAQATTPCGGWTPGADGVYCSKDRSIYMVVNAAAVRRPFGLGIARLLAHEYGHHVQEMAGIWRFYWSTRAAARTKARKLELTRRSELQAECLSAVFMSTIKRSFPVDEAEWNYAVNWFQRNGDKGWAENDHGRGKTQATWMKRGYAEAAPWACNTWSVKSGAVQ